MPSYLSRGVRVTLTRLLVACPLGLFPASAPAGIWEYDIFKLNFHTQTIADQPPASPYAYYASGRMQYDAPDAIESAFVTFDGPGSPLDLVYENNHCTAFSPTYLSAEDRDADFPAGTYTFHMVGGFYDGQTATLVLPEPLFTPVVPFFTGPTFDGLASIDPSQDFVGTVNTFPPVPGADIAFTFLAVYTEQGQAVWLADFPSSQSTFTIPSGTLAPNTPYTIYVYFSSRTFTPGSLPGSGAFAGFDQVTTASILTAPIACNLADITQIGGTAEAPGHADGQLTVDDIIVFVNLFSDGTGCPGDAPCSPADVCGLGGPPEPPDGQLTVDDVIAFFNAFGDGC